jgi:hypothetical protein
MCKSLYHQLSYNLFPLVFPRFPAKIIVYMLSIYQMHRFWNDFVLIMFCTIYSIIYIFFLSCLCSRLIVICFKFTSCTMFRVLWLSILKYFSLFFLFVPQNIYQRSGHQSLRRRGDVREFRKGHPVCLFDLFSKIFCFVSLTTRYLKYTLNNEHRQECDVMAITKVLFVSFVMNRKYSSLFFFVCLKNTVNKLEKSKIWN